MSLKNIRNVLIICTFVVISFGLGYQSGTRNFFSSSVENVSGKVSPIKDVDFSLFWDVWGRLEKFYIDKTKLDRQKMVWGAISGMVASLGDPYTVFLPPDQNKESKDDLGGKFEGIGAQLGIKDKKIIVIAPLKNSPAEVAGIKAGDWIIKVDDKETAGWTIYEAVSKIRGPKGTSVKLGIIHKDVQKPNDVTVKRETINVSSVEWKVVTADCSSNSGTNKCQIVKTSCSTCVNIIYLKLDKFGDKTSQEWNKAVSEINRDKNNANVKGLIFDLRNNPGGYLTGSVFIASEFLKDGVVVTQESISGGKESYNVNRKGTLLDIPLVVVINKGSASAAEIVAGALKERGRAKVVGETSFGKGSVQEAQELLGGAGIHITTTKWVLPSGKWINSTGIDPDIKVSNDDAKEGEDPQLEKAIETLLK